MPTCPRRPRRYRQGPGAVATWARGRKRRRTRETTRPAPAGLEGRAAARVGRTLGLWPCAARRAAADL